MKPKPNTLLWSVLSLILICMFVQPGYAKQKPTIGLIYQLDPARKVKVKGDFVPKFEYDPRTDVKHSLSKAGFRVSEAKQRNYDMTLTIEYTERMQRSQYFGDSVVVDLFRVTLTDAQDAVLFRLEHYLSHKQEAVRSYVKKRLSADISERLTHEDEIHYLVSRFDQQMSSKNLMSKAGVESTLSLLVRMFGLKDKYAEKAFLRALRSPDKRQRWIAKFGLLELGIKPDSKSQDFMQFEMVNLIDSSRIVAYNFLHNPGLLEKHKNAIRKYRMRAMIVEYGEPVIEIIIDNIRCEEIMPHLGSWYGGGSTSEINPYRVLRSMRKDQWQKYIRRFRDPSGWEWQPKWREATVSILSRQLNEEYLDLKKSTLFSYRKRLLEILSGIGDAETITFLQNYRDKHPDLAKDCEAAINEIDQ